MSDVVKVQHEALLWFFCVSFFYCNTTKCKFLDFSMPQYEEYFLKLETICLSRRGDIITEFEVQNKIELRRMLMKTKKRFLWMNVAQINLLWVLWTFHIFYWFGWKSTQLCIVLWGQSKGGKNMDLHQILGLPDKTSGNITESSTKSVDCNEKKQTLVKELCKSKFFYVDSVLILSLQR